MEKYSGHRKFSNIFVISSIIMNGCMDVWNDDKNSDLALINE